MSKSEYRLFEEVDFIYSSDKLSNGLSFGTKPSHIYVLLIDYIEIHLTNLISLAMYIALDFGITKHLSKNGQISWEMEGWTY